MKGLPPSLQNLPFASAFDTRTSFCAKGLPLRAALSALPAAPREKRKTRRETVTEGKRQRERERRREKERKREGGRSRERERKREREREDEKM